MKPFNSFRNGALILFLISVGIKCIHLISITMDWALPFYRNEHYLPIGMVWHSLPIQKKYASSAYKVSAGPLCQFLNAFLYVCMCVVYMYVFQYFFKASDWFKWGHSCGWSENDSLLSLYQDPPLQIFPRSPWGDILMGSLKVTPSSHFQRTRTNVLFLAVK